MSGCRLLCTIGILIVYQSEVGILIVPIRSRNSDSASPKRALGRRAALIISVIYDKHIAVKRCHLFAAMWKLPPRLLTISEGVSHPPLQPAEASKEIVFFKSDVRFELGEGIWC